MSRNFLSQLTGSFAMPAAENPTVADIIPNPPRTVLIREAEAKGCCVIDGLGMLVNQGVIGIKYWTGVDVDAGVMRRTVEGIFKE